MIQLVYLQYLPNELEWTLFVEARAFVALSTAGVTPG